MMARADIIQGERRRRNTDALGGNRNRMGIDESKLDRVNFEYRFINDVGRRVHDLTVNDDWEVVTDRDGLKADGAGMGSETAVAAGTAENGSPVRAVLVRKPKNYYNDDKAAQQRLIDEKEAGLGGASTEKSYVPKGLDGALTISKPG